MAEAGKRLRRYRGSSAEERRAERRAQIIAAAVQVYGERGFRNASVKAVCEAAGLTERYFYESFANSEALLVAASEQVVGVVRAAMKAAQDDAVGDRDSQTAAVLQAYFTTLKEHPRSARVFLVEISGVSKAVDQVLDDALEGFADLLTPGPADLVGPAQHLLRMGIVGGVLQMTLSWIAADYRYPLDTVVMAALKLCRTAYAGDPA